MSALPQWQNQNDGDEAAGGSCPVHPLGAGSRHALHREKDEREDVTDDGQHVDGETFGNWVRCLDRNFEEQRNAGVAESEARIDVT